MNVWLHLEKLFSTINTIQRKKEEERKASNIEVLLKGYEMLSTTADGI